MMQLLKNIWQGNYGLARTFWLLWFIPSVFFSFTFMPVLYMAVYLASTFGVNFATVVIYIYFSLVVIYSTLMYVSTWRSAGRYQGRKIWPILARLVVIISLIVDVVYITHFSARDTDDPGKHSGNIESFFKPDPEFPFIGFWKSNCSNSFGLGIAKTDEGMYSVSFCGPGGCFEPGTYRPNTTLTNDPNYRVIDENTIEVRTQDGFSRYNRCSNQVDVIW